MVERSTAHGKDEAASGVSTYGKMLVPRRMCRKRRDDTQLEWENIQTEGQLALEDSTKRAGDGARSHEDEEYDTGRPEKRNRTQETLFS